MIINSLVKYYEANSDVPIGWQYREVSFALDLSQDGKLQNIINLESQVEGKTHKRKLLLPVEPSSRASGIKPAFLCDNGGYLLAADTKRGTEKFERTKELYLSVLENIETPVSYAIKQYFLNGIPENWENDLDFESAEKSRFVFQINGKFIDYENEEFRDAWNVYYHTDEQNDNIRCVVTGKTDQPVAIHGAIKLRGGQSSGSLLISANADSFCSYGKTKNDRAAEVGKYAAFAYVSALNSLLADETHRSFIGEDTLVYWAEDGNGLEEKTFSITNEPTEQDSELLDSLMKQYASGSIVNVDGCKIDSPFHIMCLSPNAARISVRFFYTNTFSNILKNNIEHYKRMEIYKSGNDRFKYLPTWVVLSETTVSKKAKDVVPVLGGQYLYSIITGSRYPMTLYYAILNRIKAGEEINKTKAAIVKAILMRNYNEREVATVSLNLQTNNKPYVLGRLFSVLEMLQRQAIGKANSTIRDRYFASACTNPASVFPTLLKLSMHHSAKLEKSVFFEKLKTELLGKLDVNEPFPSSLNLDDQGKFILGYYHQTQDLFTSHKDKEDNEDE